MASQKRHVGLALGIGLVLAAVRSMLVYNLMEVNAYETKTYYLPDSFSVKAFSAVCIAFLLGFAFCAIRTGRKKGFELEHRETSVLPASCILAFMVFGAVIIYGYNLVTNSQAPSFIGALIIVFSIASGVWFLVSGLSTPKNSAVAFLALMPVFLVIFRLLGDFLRTNATPMASSGGYHIMSLVAVMIYFLCEGKSYLGFGSLATYLVSGYFSIVLLLVYALPNMLLHCFGVFSFDYYAGFSVVDFCTAFYICARMMNLKFIPSDEE